MTDFYSAADPSVLIENIKVSSLTHSVGPRSVSLSQPVKTFTNDSQVKPFQSLICCSRFTESIYDIYERSWTIFHRPHFSCSSSIIYGDRYNDDIIKQKLRQGYAGDGESQLSVAMSLTHSLTHPHSQFRTTCASSPSAGSWPAAPPSVWCWGTTRSGAAATIVRTLIRYSSCSSRSRTDTSTAFACGSDVSRSECLGFGLGSQASVYAYAMDIAI